jgi:hypothetical protein
VLHPILRCVTYLFFTRSKAFFLLLLGISPPVP